jgi:hypothetical protein
MKRTVGFSIFLLAVLSVLISPLYADKLTPEDLLFSLDSVYTGSATPQGTPPWLTATFTNVNTNSVQLTLAYSALNAGTGDYISNWFFNFNPALEVLGLNFSLVSGVAADPITLAYDGVLAGGDLLFDMQFSFAANSFNPGASSVYLISSTVDSIDALSFSFLSTNASGLTNYYSSANILGSGSWIASATAQTPGPGPGPAPVAEPASVILLGLGLGGLTVFGRKKLFA